MDSSRLWSWCGGSWYLKVRRGLHGHKFFILKILVFLTYYCRARAYLLPIGWISYLLLYEPHIFV